MNLASPRMGGAKRLCFTSQRTQRDSNPQPPTTPTSLSTRRVLYHLRAMRPVILFRTTGWLNHVRGGRTPFTDLGDQCFRGRTNPDHQRKTEELLLQFTLLCRTGIIAHATRLFRSTIVHLALLWGCVTPLHRLGSPPVGACRTVLKKEAHESFSPPPRRKLRQ